MVIPGNQYLPILLTNKHYCEQFKYEVNKNSVVAVVVDNTKALRENYKALL